MKKNENVKICIACGCQFHQKDRELLCDVCKANLKTSIDTFPEAWPVIRIDITSITDNDDYRYNSIAEVPLISEDEDNVYVWYEDRVMPCARSLIR